MPPVLVVGTRNRKKLGEIVEILGDLPLEVRDLSGWPDAPEVVEDGATFEANARKKATELARHLQQWVLGEDSGLVVPGLNGRPGVYSARYAGKQGDDEANNDRLLAELAPLPDDRRAAYYVCTAALADPAGEVRAVAEGLELGAYRFTKYLTGDRKPKTELATVVVGAAGKLKASAKALVALGQKVGAAVNLSRDLSNEPPNVMFPEAMAAAGQGVAKAGGLKIEVFDFKEIRRRGMKLIDAVGRGSRHEPRFVHITYAPKGAKKKLVFVGKGITFDSGGLSIKPAAGMGEMKHDMSGAANVVALMAAVAAVKPKGVEVHAIASCAENMPDGD
ncbi:MAG TPA: non-canonical purine NTP pyrophosphatase, partial [Gemmataceae bacterium]|nr:non-canonical purine NTP pyrophosphatase [Gemmataceae bacterium]